MLLEIIVCVLAERLLGVFFISCVIYGSCCYCVDRWGLVLSDVAWTGCEYGLPVWPCIESSMLIEYLQSICGTNEK